MKLFFQLKNCYKEWYLLFFFIFIISFFNWQIYKYYTFTKPKTLLINTIETTKKNSEQRYNYYKQIITQNNLTISLKNIINEINLKQQNQIILKAKKYFFDIDIRKINFLNEDLSFLNTLIIDAKNIKNKQEIAHIKYYFIYQEKKITEKLEILSKIINQLHQPKTFKLLSHLRSNVNNNLFIWPEIN